MKNTVSKFRYHLLEKKYGSINLQRLYRIFKKIFIYLMYIYIPASALATVTNNVILKEERYAAILLSGYAFSDYDYWASPIAFLGSYPAWTLYFNLNGVKTDYFFNATKNDMKNVLIDPKYESIVMVGHGSRNGWRATDRFVSNDDINEWKEEFAPKTGEWFQLSCAGDDTYPEHIGELVMDDIEKVYYYSGDVAGNTMFVTDALTGFRLMKYQTHKRRLINND
jgi:hypothetical protein